jgi:hypothetical protein
MKQNDTNLFQIDVEYIQRHTTYVRVPKEYEDSYELTKLIKCLVQEEQLDIDEYNYDDRHIDIDSVQVNLIDCDLDETTTLLIPSCKPEDLTIENIQNVTFKFSEIDEDDFDEDDCDK